MRLFKKWMGLVLGAVMSCHVMGMTASAKPDWPSDVFVEAEAGIVIDADSGAMIFGQNSKLPYYPASITKLLTALIVLEHASLDEMVTYSNDAVYNVEEGSGNPAGLDTGDVLSVKDSLYVMVLRSSNQAANALAEHVAGSRDGFVDMMNAKLAELGCTDSKFKNPSGLNDSEQVVTPYDMATVAKAAFENPQLLEIASTKSYKLPATKNNPEGFPFTIEHKIIKAEHAGSQFYCEGAMAGKTGYTSIAGSTLVTYAERDGRRLIAVVLKGKPTQYYLDTISLLNFGFENTKNVDVNQMEASYIAGDKDVVIGDKSYKPEELEFRGPAVVTLPPDAEYGDADKTFDTNVPEGSPEGALAVLRYTYNGRKVGEVYLRLKQAEEADAPAEEAVSQSEAETEDSPPHSPSAENVRQSGGNPDSDEKGPGIAAPWNGRLTLILLGIAVVIGVAMAAGVGYLIYESKKEKEQAELRRAKRRTRLMETGISEEEFDRLVDERRNRKRDEGQE